MEHSAPTDELHTSNDPSLSEVTTIATSSGAVIGTPRSPRPLTSAIVFMWQGFRAGCHRLFGDLAVSA
jgi:hypothetical protein